ncbi:acyl-CoA carboxylase epsilon subunit [Streptomyces sp. NPDC086783]|uniref:acyl-CoA carboxylase epsilon subunit n=1 Tax=Streptomyces sp. NPDC086783 TaxID=3365758 RepID=UPI00380B911E
MTTAEEPIGQIRVVRGVPDAEELAALLTVLTSLSLCSKDAARCRTRRRAHWDHGIRPHLPPSSWRHSAHPLPAHRPN